MAFDSSSDDDADITAALLGYAYEDDELPDPELSDNTVKELKGVKKTVGTLTRWLPAYLRMDKEGRIIHGERVRTYNKGVATNLKAIASREKQRAIQTRIRETRKRRKMRRQMEKRNLRRLDTLRRKQEAQDARANGATAVNQAEALHESDSDTVSVMSDDDMNGVAEQVAAFFAPVLPVSLRADREGRRLYRERQRRQNHLEREKRERVRERERLRRQKVEARETKRSARREVKAAAREERAERHRVLRAAGVDVSDSDVSGGEEEWTFNEEGQRVRRDTGVAASDTDVSSVRSDESLVEYRGVLGAVAGAIRWLPASLRLDTEGQYIHKERTKTARRLERHRLRLIKARDVQSKLRVGYLEQKKRDAMRRRERRMEGQTMRFEETVKGRRNVMIVEGARQDAALDSTRTRAARAATRAAAAGAGGGEDGSSSSGSFHDAPYVEQLPLDNTDGAATEDVTLDDGMLPTAAGGIGGGRVPRRSPRRRSSMMMGGMPPEERLRLRLEDGSNPNDIFVEEQGESDWEDELELQGYSGIRGALANMSRALPASLRFDSEGRRLHHERQKTYAKSERDLARRRKAFHDRRDEHAVRRLRNQRELLAETDDKKMSVRTRGGANVNSGSISGTPNAAAAANAAANGRAVQARVSMYSPRSELPNTKNSNGDAAVGLRATPPAAAAAAAAADDDDDDARMLAMMAGDDDDDDDDAVELQNWDQEMPLGEDGTVNSYDLHEIAYLDGDDVSNESSITPPDDGNNVGVTGSLAKLTAVLPISLRLDPKGRRLRKERDRRLRRETHARDRRKLGRDLRAHERRVERDSKHSVRVSAIRTLEARLVVLRERRRQLLVAREAAVQLAAAGGEAADGVVQELEQILEEDTRHATEETALLLKKELDGGVSASDEDAALRSDDTILASDGLWGNLQQATAVLPQFLRLDREGRTMRREQQRTTTKQRQQRDRTLRYRRKMQTAQLLVRERRKQEKLVSKELSTKGKFHAMPEMTTGGKLTTAEVRAAAAAGDVWLDEEGAAIENKARDGSDADSNSIEVLSSDEDTFMHWVRHATKVLQPSLTLPYTDSH